MNDRLRSHSQKQRRQKNNSTISGSRRFLKNFKKLGVEFLEDRRLLSTIMSAALNTNPGWTTSGQWAFGQPAGLTQNPTNSYPDPTSGYTGLNVYGVNLYGDYSATVGGPYYLKTSAINCANYTNVILSFQRWLNTDASDWVSATVDVSNNGTTWNSIYSNYDGVVDSSWQFMQYDISSYANNKATVYIRWGYQVFRTDAYPCSGWNIDDITLTGDSANPGVTVNPTSGLTTTEAGGTATFTMVLNTQPTANVTIGLSSNDTSEGTVSPANVTFNSSNWATPQTVTVTGVNDAFVDGNIAYSIVTAAASSTDLNYNGLNPADVSVTNLDNDVATLTLTVGSPTVSEAAGAYATTGTVTRNTDTTNPLVVTLTSSDTSEATVPASVTIPAGQASATFDIAAVDDTIIDGTQTVTITASAAIVDNSVGLDTSFGTGGLATTSLDMFFQPPDTAMAVQSDGKILAASECTSDAYAWRITRLKTDGSLDTSFGVNGIVDTPFSTAYPSPKKILVQPDGKIMVGGAFLSGSNVLALARYNSNGSLDATFGSGGIASFPGIADQWIEDMVQQPDGKTLLALGISGVVYTRVARINANGSLDATFGSGGIKTFYDASVVPRAIALMSDGRFVLSGDFENESQILRANADGSLDATFGIAGMQTVNFGSDYTVIRNVVIDHAGRIVLGGSAYSNVYNSGNFAAARLNPNGSFDTSFSQDGIALVDFPAGLDDIAFTMVVQIDDKIVLSGYSEVYDYYQQVALARLKVDGTLDASFDGDGRLLTSISSDSSQQANRSVLLPDGKLLVLAGWGADWRVAKYKLGITPLSGTATLNVTDNDGAKNDYGDAPAQYATAEPLAEGTLDNTFSGDGKQLTDMGGTYDGVEGLALQSDGKILAVGTGSSNAFAIARYLPDGTLDTSFSGDGKLVISSSGGGSAVVPLSNGKILIGLYKISTRGFRVIRLNNDGSYDTTFGVNGEAFIATGGTQPSVADMLVQPDGKIILVGYDFFSSNWDGVIVRFNANGTLDTSFGSGGMIQTDFDRTEITDPIDFFTCGLLLPDGKILAGGCSSTTSEMSTGNRIYALARYLPDGSPDLSFGSGGERTFTFTTSGFQQETISDMLLLSDGKVLAASGGGSTTALIRLNADESIDTTFGTGGRIIAPTGSVYRDPRQIILDKAGRILAVGGGIAVTRLLNDGSVDTSFGTNGSTTVSFGGSLEGAAAIAMQPDGKIIAGGYSGTANVTSDYVLIRLSSALPVAKHKIVTGFYLGNGVDDEGDGQPTAAANGDDATGIDDEDGVVFTSPVLVGSSATLSVTASAAGYLNAWIDFNQDGDWSDAGEQVFADRSLTSGANALSFTAPATAVVTNQTYARFRFSSTPGLNYYGSALDGEVEDYAITITTSPASVGDVVWLDSNANGIHDAGEPGVPGAGVEIYSSTDSTVGNSDDSLVAQTVTDNAGNYALGNLTPNLNYYLKFRTPVGYTFTAKDAGSNDALDSDVDSTGVTALFTLSGGQSDATRDTGMVGSSPSFGWAIGFGGTTDDAVTQMVTDAQGNVYIAGVLSGTADFDNGPGIYNLTSAGDYDTVVAKYSSTGALIWAKQWGGAERDVALCLNLGPNSTLYVSGFFRSTVDFDPSPNTYNLTSSGASDIFVVKLDSAGNMLWADGIGGVSTEQVNSMVVDNAGNLLIAGYFNETVDFDPGAGTFSMTSAAYSDIFISKLDSAGNFVWAKRMGGTNSELACSIALGVDGSIYTGGEFSSTVDFDPGTNTANLTSYGLSDIFISKLDQNGNYLWAKKIGGSGYDRATALALGADGSIFSTGYFQGTVDFDPGSNTYNLTSPGTYQRNDIFVAKFDAAGNFVWARNMGGTENDGGAAILLANDGGVLTTGTFQITADFDPGAGTVNRTSAGGDDVFISKLDASGKFVWVRSMGGTSRDAPGEIIWGNDGSLLCSGEFSNTVDFNPGGGTFNLVSNGGFDAFVVKMLEQGPSDINLSTSTIAEHQPIGSVIGSLSTVDPVSNDTYVYAIVSGAGDGDNAYFTISGNQLKTNAVFNYETKSSYTIRVRSTSGRGLWIEKNITITIADAAEESVGGILWRDTDADGVRDASETGVEDALVRLFYSPDATIGNSDDRLAGEALTDAQGSYGFHEVAHGMNYYLSFYAPPGLSFTTRDAGGDDNQDSDTDATGNTGLFALSAGQTMNNLSAGLIGMQPVSGWAISSGGSSYADAAQATVQDAAGNIFVTGFFTGTVDFDPSPQIYNLTASSSGVVFVAKYSSAGSLLWASLLGGASGASAYSIAVANDGSVYTLGSFAGTADFDPGPGTYNLISSGANALFISKLDSNGNFVWAKKLDLEQYGGGKAIAVAPSGNILITGYFDGSRDFDPGSDSFIMTCAAGYDAFVEKLSPAGDFVWARRLGGLGDDRSWGIAVGSDESIVTTGDFYNTADFDPGAGTCNIASKGGLDIYISKLDTNGNFVWAQGIGGTNADRAWSVALKSNGSVLVTGSFSGSVDFDTSMAAFNLTSAGAEDAFIVQYTSEGNFSGAWQMGGSSSDSGKAVSVGPDDSVFVLGLFSGTADFNPNAEICNLSSKGYQDIFVVKLNPSGGFAWARTIGGTKDDYGYSLSAGSNGSVVGVGMFSDTVDFDPGPSVYNITAQGTYDFFITKFDAIHPPTDILASATTIAENQPVNTVVAQLSASDPDAGDSHVYTLASGTGSADNGAFVIDGNQLKSNAIFDSKTKSSYSIRIRAVDATGLYLEKVFTIQVVAIGPVTRTWDGGGSDNYWTTAANWVGDLAPSPGDLLVFPAGTSRLESINNYPLGTKFDSITITGNGHIFHNGISSTSSVQVPSGTLSVESIVADALIIGTPIGPATRTWDGGGADNKWSTAANWAGDVAPIAGDNLVFPADAAKLQSVNDFPANTVFGSITVSGGNYLFQNGITSSSSIRISSGSLTTSSIVCDSLTIGSTSGTSGTAPTSFANDSVVQTTAVPHSVASNLATSTDVHNATLPPKAIDSPMNVFHPRLAQTKAASTPANPAASVPFSACAPRVVSTAMPIVHQTIPTLEIASAVNSMAKIDQPKNKSEVAAPLPGIFADALIADLNSTARTASFNPFQLTERLKDSVYGELADSLVAAKNQPFTALTGSQNAHNFALQSLVRDYPHNFAIEQIDSDLLVSKHFHKQDKLAKKAVDDFHADWVGAIE